jgi:hypothetical protein
MMLYVLDANAEIITRRVNDKKNGAQMSGRPIGVELVI